jgi:8-oxo-dGTP pyrophosphatase MutT (NUDIX family)
VITLERDLARVIGVRASVSAVIFDRQGRVLLQQRSDGGQWGLPGGSVEIGESLHQAVAREVSEETGLRVTASRLPRTLLPNHRIRIRDARARRVAPFVR